MGAITNRHSELGLDDIRRYRTKCKVRLDSHGKPDPLFISDDVVSIKADKTIKGAGQAILTLTPSRNYLNIIRPNDYINIYFNIGDGEGWTRTFFGMVDKIEEFYAVGPDGKPSTYYTVICTDFFKVFNNTNIYFNPQLAGRSDLSGEYFGTSNIGGLALMNMGVRVHGSPADIVVNTILLLLGFGTQWSLPVSYNARFRDTFRDRRAQFIQNRLGEDARNAIEQAGGFQRLLEQLRAEETGTARTLANERESIDEHIQALFRERGIVGRDEQQRLIQATDAGDVDQIAAILADRRAIGIINPSNPQRFHDTDIGFFNILRHSTPEAVDSFLDIIDVFGFVERTAIDGYIAGTPINQESISLASLINAYSNEVMNEVIFDLRPRSNSSLGELDSADYSRMPDEIEGNIDGEGDNGITLCPALIMREYPFSVIDGIDLSGVRVNLAGSAGEIGIVYFGEIFSDRPNEPGRHIVHIPNINIEDRRLNRGTILSPKHLDVAVVHEQEIIKSELARSDQEHFNMMSFWSDGVLGADQRFYMHDLLPIVTPIHVLRHGLRVRDLTTRFVRFDHHTADRVQEAPEPPPEREEAEAAAAPSTAPVIPGADVVLPVEGGAHARFYNNHPLRWGYRAKPRLGYWSFHQGVDITSGDLNDTPAAYTIPIYAIADGEVIASAPTGVFGGYGQVIAIRHNFDGDIIYTTYAHLSGRLVGLDLDVRRATRADRRKYAVSGFGGGDVMQPIRVQKGQQIGFMGNTGINVDPRHPFYNTHLHFEVCNNWPPARSSITPRIPFEEFPDNHATDPSGRPPTPAGYNRSIDPVVFFAAQGINLRDAVNGGITDDFSDVPEQGEPDDFEHGPEDEADGQRPREDVLPTEPEQQPGEIVGAVDTALSRQQIIRWALLQDHWYQHNLEYLAGIIEMRGAPEIRVGYRLDIPERNMSFYVESVNHTWQFPDKLTTVLQVTRGQRNDPYPMYVLPPLAPFEPTVTQRRTSTGRLSTYFVVPDPVAVRRSLVFRQNNSIELTPPVQGEGGLGIINTADSGGSVVTYNERVVLTGSVDPITVPEEQSVQELTRISGDLRVMIENIVAENALDGPAGLDQVLTKTFDFEGIAAENPTDGSATETSSGVTGTDPSASLERMLGDEAFRRLLGT